MYPACPRHTNMKIFQITVVALFAYIVASIAAQQIASKMVDTGPHASKHRGVRP
jgi:hypothetical protein